MAASWLVQATGAMPGEKWRTTTPRWRPATTCIGVSITTALAPHRQVLPCDASPLRADLGLRDPPLMREVPPRRLDVGRSVALPLAVVPCRHVLDNCCGVRSRVWV